MSDETSSSEPKMTDLSREDTELETAEGLYNQGRFTWHSSDDDGGPDVGLSLGLGDGAMLWVGELPNKTLEENGIDPAKGDGWWIAVYGDKSVDVIGAVVSETHVAQELVERLSALIPEHCARADSPELTRLRERVKALEAGLKTIHEAAETSKGYPTLQSEEVEKRAHALLAEGAAK